MFLLKFHELHGKLSTGFPALGERQSRALAFILERGLRQLCELLAIKNIYHQPLE